MKTRVATCLYPNGTVAANSVCDEAGIVREALEQPCNTKACKTYAYFSSAWSDCDRPCGGERTRMVYCACVPSSPPFLTSRQDCFFRVSIQSAVFGGRQYYRTISVVHVTSFNIDSLIPFTCCAVQL
jgi:hypothetical protein